MSESKELSQEELDLLLDGTLDDIADLPTFENFKAGAHRVLASWSAERIGEKIGVKLNFTHVETLQLDDPSQAPDVEGQQCSTVFFLDNEYGAGNFKRVAGPFADHFGYDRNAPDTKAKIVGLKDVECVLVSGLKVGKVKAGSPEGTPAPVYLEVKEIQVV